MRFKTSAPEWIKLIKRFCIARRPTIAYNLNCQSLTKGFVLGRETLKDMIIFKTLNSKVKSKGFAWGEEPV